MTFLLAQASTIPEDSGGPYVVAAYVIFVVTVVVYLAIMAQRLRKVARQADELEQRVAQLRAGAQGGEPQDVRAALGQPEAAATGDGGAR